MDAQVAVVTEDVQVPAKPRRRTYTAEYKRRILKEADACTAPGAIGVKGKPNLPRCGNRKLPTPGFTSWPPRA
jgi:hypothetical protein